LLSRSAFCVFDPALCQLLARHLRKRLIEIGRGGSGGLGSNGAEQFVLDFSAQLFAFGGG
jgi:hypothetical protein